MAITFDVSLDKSVILGQPGNYVDTSVQVTVSNVDGGVAPYRLERIDWNDGSPPEILNIPIVGSASAPHSYDPASYPTSYGRRAIYVRVIDNIGATATAYVYLRYITTYSDSQVLVRSIGIWSFSDFEYCTCSTNTKILVFGGDGGADNTATAIYDVGTDTWSAGPALNDPRLGHYAVGMSDGTQAIAAGGNNPDSIPNLLSSVEIFDRDANIWNVSSPLNTPRYKFAGLKLDSGEIVISGGMTEYHSPESTTVAPPVTDSVERYDPLTGMWSQSAETTDATFYTCIKANNITCTDDAGIWKATLSPSGTAWEHITIADPDYPTPSRLYNSIYCTPSNGNIYVVFRPDESDVHDVKTYKSTDGGGTWTRLAPPVGTAIWNSSFPHIAGYIHLAVFDDGADGVIAGWGMEPDPPYQYYIFRSLDGGSTWSMAANPTPSVTDFHLDFAGHDYNQLYAWTAGTVSIYYSGDLGDTWTLKNSSFAKKMIVPHPQDGYVWAAVSGDGLYLSSDYGTTFNKVWPAAPATSNVQTVAIDPNDPDTIYVGTQEVGTGHSIYRSRRGVASVADDFVVINSAHDDTLPNQIVVAPTGNSIFLSSDDFTNMQFFVSYNADLEEKHAVFRAIGLPPFSCLSNDIFEEPNHSLITLGGTTSTDGMLAPREEHSMIHLYDGYLLAAGGRTNWNFGSYQPEGITPEIELYDPYLGRWEFLENHLSVRRRQMGAVLLGGGKVLFYGGQNGLTNSSGVAELFDPEDNSVTALGGGAARTRFTLSAMHDGSALAPGGWSVVALSGVQSISAAGVFSSKTAMPAARYDYASVVLPDGKLFLAGGKDSSDNPTDTTWVYDPALNTWSVKATMPFTRSSMSAVVIDYVDDVCRLLVDVTPDTTTLSVCQEVTLTVSVSLGTPPYTYQWTEDGLDLAGETGDTLVITKDTAGTHTYNCKVTDSDAMIDITDPIDATVTWEEIVISGASLAFNYTVLSVPDEWVGYEWYQSDTDGVLGDLVPYSDWHSLSVNTSGYYTVIVDDGLGHYCQATKYVEVYNACYDYYVNELCDPVVCVEVAESQNIGPAEGLHASILATPNSGLAPLMVSFTATVAGGVGPYTYDWDFGDGSPHSYGVAPTHIYTSAPNVYSVTLLVGDVGMYATASTTVTTTVPT